MARQDEILFLKVAIKNNLLSKEDANLCLKELGSSEGRIGQIAVQKKLMEPTQVKQIYAVVDKMKAKQPETQQSSGSSTVQAPAGAQPRRPTRAGSGKERVASVKTDRAHGSTAAVTASAAAPAVQGTRRDRRLPAPDAVSRAKSTTASAVVGLPSSRM